MNKKVLYESLMKNVAKQVKKSLNESVDGWDEDELYDLKEILDDCYDLAYEIKNCVRGSCTSCTTYKELAEYLKELSDKLMMQAEYLENIDDPYDEEDE